MPAGAGSVWRGPSTLGGRRVFVKRDDAAPTGFFAAEAWGLRWLAAARAVAVPEVVEVDGRHIAVALIEEGSPTPASAAELGRALGDLHAAGADGFGAPVAGFIGPLPMDNRPGPGADWPSFYAEHRVLPYLRLAADRGAVDRPGAAAVERAVASLAERLGDAGREPPARIHGDLWSGNVLWGVDGSAWLIDPAAHGGHRETDLAMLALFGAPHLDVILAAYDEHRPLADGWRERVPLHQLHPLLVHAVLFGAGYGSQAVGAARRCP